MVSEENTDTVIHLPSLFPPIDSKRKEFYDNYLGLYVYKITTFTPDPIDNPKDLICVVIFEEFCELAYIRPIKDTIWTRITGMERVLFDDVIYFNDKFYALTYKGKLTSFDATDPLESEIKLETDENPSNEEKDLIPYKRYLIKSHEGELLQVQRYKDCDRDLNHVTKKFKVFKLTPDESRWVEMKSLGYVAIFLGDNSSTSIMASNFAGCQGNCIYFTHDKDTLTFGTHGPSDMGMYNIESQSFTSFSNIDAEIIAKMEGEPIWVVPS
ncbi:hypothetical protein TIFTF001_013851 [Ficus carica]|uniref:KIB1-4 beta-propeller domain-containing protein n=1 Tax=Ficus carica TaxID=3494 RepID=A0AA88D6E9_FICCA|nr:hypothetical protein TIFTF001_013851 [Ficus carica]